MGGLYSSHCRTGDYDAQQDAGTSSDAPTLLLLADDKATFPAKEPLPAQQADIDATVVPAELKASSPPASASPDPDSPLPGPAGPKGPVGDLRVERVYDFYDSATRNIQVLPMTGEVIHNRPRAGCRSPMPPYERNATGSPTSESQFSSSAGSSSTPSLGFSGARSPDQELAVSSLGSSQSRLPNRLPRPERSATTSTSVEAITRWGVLAGKVLYYRVLAFTTIGNRLISRSKNERSKRDGVWKRVQGRARRVTEQARALARRVANEPVDRLDSEWTEESLLTTLFSTEYLDTLMILAKASKKLLAGQPVLAEATVPCRVFGDIHGQFRDLLLLFHAFGFPSERNPVSYIFNGDFVDRGSHQLEVIGLLLALKVALPQKVWLVRGNHEDRSMNEKYGFMEHCYKHLGEENGKKTFDLMEEAFDQLPIACLVAQRILVVHGGIGNGGWDLNELRAVQRPIGEKELNNPLLSWILNILWSDPIEDDEDDETGNAGIFGVHESPRIGAALLFGWNVTKTFCARNGLQLIVRSHQSKADGLGFDIMHEDMLVRVFSARDYEGHGNDGAVLLITPGQDEAVPVTEAASLTVRPQILRSVTKSRDAAGRLLIAAKRRPSRPKVKAGSKTKAKAKAKVALGSSDGSDGEAKSAPPVVPRLKLPVVGAETEVNSVLSSAEGSGRSTRSGTSSRVSL